MTRYRIGHHSRYGWEYWTVQYEDQSGNWCDQTVLYGLPGTKPQPRQYQSREEAQRHIDSCRAQPFDIYEEPQ